MNIDDDLIDNLRTALEEYRRTGTDLLLLSAADEIVQDRKLATARVIRDADNDLWHHHPDDHWCLNQQCTGFGEHGNAPYFRHVQAYSPLTVVE